MSAGATTPTTVELLERLAEEGTLVSRGRTGLRIDAADPERRAGAEGLVAGREAEVLEVLAESGPQGLLLLGEEGQRGKDLPLTDLQSAYEVGESGFLELTTPAYVAHGYEVPDLSVERLQRALRETLERHEMLRAAPTDGGGQRIAAVASRDAPEIVDWEGVGPEEAMARFLDECRGAGSLLPALSAGRQLSCVVFRSDRTNHVLVGLRLFGLDARSIGLVLRDLGRAYDGVAKAAGPGRPGVFARYLAGLETYRRGQGYRNSRAHWRRRWASLPAAPELPRRGGTDVPHQARFGRLRHSLDAARWTALQEAARSRGLSPNSVLCAAYAEVLQRWSGAEEITLTSLVSTRAMVVGSDDLAGCVGNFGSTMLLATDGSGGSFVERARRLQERIMEDLPHALVSAVQLAREGIVATGPANVPFVFASGLDGSDGLPSTVEAEGWHLAFKQMQTPQVLVDHQVSEERGELICNFDHVEGAFAEGAIEEAVAYHRELLAALVADEEAWSDTAPRRLPPEALAARERANRTDAPRPAGSLLSGLTETAASDPSRLAFAAANETLSYAEAEAAIAAIAASLGAPREEPEIVGVLARKGVEQYLAAAAVIHHGDAYLPLSTSWPPARIEAVLQSAGVARVLVDDRGTDLLGVMGVETSAVPISAAGATAGEAGAPRAQGPEALAYVIFTSGSTGTPKGVAVSRGGVLNTIADVVHRFDLGPEDRILALSELNFDLSAFDLFGALHAGAAAVIPPVSSGPDPEAWARCIREHRVTVWNSVPALMEMLLDHCGERAAEVLASVRLVMLSGDWIPVDLPDRIRRVNPTARVVALGGATEASIWSNYYEVGTVDPSWTSIPYGVPLANQRFAVRDRHGADAPNMVAGELVIEGAGVAEGYLGDAELTALRFPPDPRTGRRAYRTGDLGRYLLDGNLEILGRIDRQAKLHGHRIDLMEIEKHLCDQAGVRGAACVVSGEHAARTLIAFVVPEREPVDADRLRGALLDLLPAYAVPQRIEPIEALPVTANGKRDIAALERRAAGEGALPTAAGGDPPRTPTERWLARLWRDLCGREVDGVYRDFFAIGGNSLLAVRLARTIESNLGVTVPLSRLVAARTVASQADLIEAIRAEEPDAGVLVPLKGSGGPVVAFVHPVGGHLLAYRGLVDLLPAGVEAVGIQSPPAEELPATLTELAARYASELEALGQGRPIHLVGWSFGAVVAFEMARRLPVESVTLIDPLVGATDSSPEFKVNSTTAFLRDYLRDPHLDSVDGDSGAEALADAVVRLRAIGLLPADADPAMFEALFAQYDHLSRLLLAHRPAAVPDCELQMFVAGVRLAGFFPGLTPLRLPAEVTADPLVIDADHYSIVEGQAAAEIVRGLDAMLAPRAVG